jgi:nitrile hydratase accessory protein
MSGSGFVGLPGTRSDQDDPVFRAPWEAQAFAMAVTLSDLGYFTWSDWSARLAREIAEAAARGEIDDGRRYYHHWLAALEGIVAERGILSTDELADSTSGPTPPEQPLMASRSSCREDDDGEVADG